jgi:glycosyltransferase involved in cell wall biosynthesis
MPENDRTMTLPALSIVVIGRNEGQRLVRCLQSIASIHSVHEGIEVLYVDSASSDGSPEVAARLGAQTIVLNATHPTAALGRNAGWKQAAAQFILFLDGDTILDPDFPARAFAAILADESVAAVWGHRREIHPENSIYNRILDLDWIYPPGPAEFCGGDVLMRRAALEAAGGYDGTLIAGEEPELCRRMRALGCQILHIDAPMTGHDLEMRRFRQYWKRALRAGHAYAEVSSRFRRSGDPFWQSERVGNFRRGGFWIFSFLAAGIASILLHSILPAALWLVMLAVLSLRSAWKARWKSTSAPTLLAYGLHSQLQQVPICIGQLSYDLNPRKGQQKKLIEYKGASSHT